MTATPLVRATQIRFFSRNTTYSSIFGRKVVEELAELLNQRRRKIAFDTADAIPTGRQPRAAQFVEPIQQNFPIAETVKKDGHRADVRGLGTQPELMTDDALDFCDDGTQVVRTVRNGDVHELFDCATVGKVVVHGADIVEPIRMRNKLMVGAVLGQLFHTAVQEPHDRRGLHQPFPSSSRITLSTPCVLGC